MNDTEVLAEHPSVPTAPTTSQSKDCPVSGSADAHNGLICRHNDFRHNTIVSYPWKRLAFTAKSSRIAMPEKMNRRAGEEK